MGYRLAQGRSGKNRSGLRSHMYRFAGNQQRVLLTVQQAAEILDSLSITGSPGRIGALTERLEEFLKSLDVQAGHMTRSLAQSLEILEHIDHDYQRSLSLFERSFPPKLCGFDPCRWVFCFRSRSERPAAHLGKILLGSERISGNGQVRQRYCFTVACMLSEQRDRYSPRSGLPLQYREEPYPQDHVRPPDP